jgi:hypothetical protein
MTTTTDDAQALWDRYAEAANWGLRPLEDEALTWSLRDNLPTAEHAKAEAWGTLCVFLQAELVSPRDIVGGPDRAGEGEHWGRAFAARAGSGEGELTVLGVDIGNTGAVALIDESGELLAVLDCHFAVEADSDLHGLALLMSHYPSISRGDLLLGLSAVPKSAFGPGDERHAAMTRANVGEPHSAHHASKLALGFSALSVSLASISARPM